MSEEKLEVAAKHNIVVQKDSLKLLLNLEKTVLNKPMPSAPELEEVVLGAILIDSKAMIVMRPILEPKHFYAEKHQIIYKAMVGLYDNKVPTDLVLVAEALKQQNKLDKVEGAFYLAGLANRVASAANIEHHARIIVQMWLYRDGLEQCLQYAKKLVGREGDVFDLRNQLADNIRTRPPHSFFKFDDFDNALERGDEAPELKKMCGTLWNRTEVCFFFGPPGTGKSIFCIQIANALSKGLDVIPDILVNECEPQKVLYIDFELTDRNLKNRYSNSETNVNYKFDSDYLKRASINPDFLDYDDRLDKIAQQQIENLILTFKPSVMIVDNITFLTSESNHDTDIAKKLMKKLVYYKRQYDLSLLVVAHTTKGASKFMPLMEKDMAGSAQLQNFADSIFGIKTSAQDENMKYLKQFKDRNEPKVLTDENVMAVEPKKGGAERNFLQFELLQFSRERDHLAMPDDDSSAELLVMEACKLKAEKGQGFGYRKVAKELGWARSVQNLIDKMKAYAQASDEYSVTDRGHITFVKPF